MNTSRAAAPSTDATSEWTLSPAADDTTLAAPSLDTPWSATPDAPDRSTRQETSGTSDGRGPWDHQPDPEATNTGFYVDWGTADETTDEPTGETTGEIAVETTGDTINEFEVETFDEFQPATRPAPSSTTLLPSLRTRATLTSSSSTRRRHRPT